MAQVSPPEQAQEPPAGPSSSNSSWVQRLFLACLAGGSSGSQEAVTLTVRKRQPKCAPPPPPTTGCVPPLPQHSQHTSARGRGSAPPTFAQLPLQGRTDIRVLIARAGKAPVAGGNSRSTGYSSSSAEGGQSPPTADETLNTNEETTSTSSDRSPRTGMLAGSELLAQQQSPSPSLGLPKLASSLAQERIRRGLVAAASSSVPQSGGAIAQEGQQQHSNTSSTKLTPVPDSCALHCTTEVSKLATASGQAPGARPVSVGS